MIVTPWERSSAQRFHDLLEADRPTAHNELSSMVGVTQRLEFLGQSFSRNVDVDPTFRERLRTRLVAVASVQQMGTDAPARPRRSDQRSTLPRRAALISATIAVLIGLSGVGVASSDAVPGDALYGVKRSREAAQLALAGSDVSRGQLHLQFARTRLSEAYTVRNDGADLRRALDDMDADTRTAMRELTGVAVERRAGAPLDLVDDFVTDQRAELVGLISAIPSDRRQRALDSLEVLDQVQERSQDLRGSLSCTGGVSGANRNDELGAIPRRCVALEPVEPGGKRNSPITGQPKAAEASPSAPEGKTLQPSAEPGQGISPLAKHGDPATGPSANSPSAGASNDGGLLGGISNLLGGVLGGLLGRG